MSEARPAPGSALPPLSDGQLVDWLRLIRTETVGAIGFRLLINRYGGAAAAIAALPDLSRRGGRVVSAPPPETAEREIAALARFGGRFVALGDPDYPPALRHADGAPPLLAVAGRSDILRRATVSIVGSRDASALGRRFARDLAFGLGAGGYVVASGLARGIDVAAHEGALSSGTIAVLAGGLDRLYPPENEAIYAKIRADGVAVSEMPMGHVPVARDFPRRNRIVAGVALGVVVVEAAKRSGSLITARLAGELGREVLAVPGHPLDPRAAGANGLLRDGATLATSAEDVIEALAGMTTERLPDPEPILFRSSGADPGDGEPAPGVRERIAGLLSPSRSRSTTSSARAGQRPATCSWC